TKHAADVQRSDLAAPDDQAVVFLPWQVPLRGDRRGHEAQQPCHNAEYGSGHPGLLALRYALVLRATAATDLPLVPQIVVLVGESGLAFGRRVSRERPR